MPVHKLTKYLAEQELSENEAADLLGIPQSSINRITREGLPPSLKTAACIVKGTDGAVSYDDLLTPELRRKTNRLRGTLAA